MAILNEGDRAPAVTFSTTKGPVTLDDLVAQSTAGAIIYAYPKAMTPACTAEACDFRDSWSTLTAAGYTVIGVSPDPLERLARFAERDALPFLLASDPEHEILEAFGAWGEKKNYGRVVVGVIRSTIVVAPSGEVSLARYNVKATGHVARLLRDLGM